MNCAQCGHLLPDLARFCPSCGSGISNVPAGETGAAPVEATPHAAISPFIRWLGIGFLWLIVISQAFMVVAFVTTGKKLPPALAISFALVCGGAAAVHVSKKRTLWFAIVSVAGFIVAAVLSAIFRTTA